MALSVHGYLVVDGYFRQGSVYLWAKCCQVCLVCLLLFNFILPYFNSTIDSVDFHLFRLRGLPYLDIMKYVVFFTGCQLSSGI